MIERATLEALAASRTVVRVRLRYPAREEDRDAVILWREAPDDAWRVLFHEPTGAYGPGLLFPATEDLLHERAYRLEPVDFAAPIRASLSDPSTVALTEAALVCGRFGLRATFGYTRTPLGSREERRGKVTSVRDGLLRIEDADRGGAVRGFRLDRIDGFRPLEVTPRWDGRGYVLPVIA